MSMHLSQGSSTNVPSSSKRKLDSYAPQTRRHSPSSASAYSSSFSSPSGSHAPAALKAEILDWAQSQEGREAVQGWLQIDNIWTKRAEIWSQREFGWYKEMSDLYRRWSTDENSDKSMHPSDLIWAFMKLDQAKREATHCMEWVAYARWQCSSKTGRVVEVCPVLPSLEGRVHIANRDKPLLFVKEKDERNGNGGDGNGNSDGGGNKEGCSAGFGPVQYSVQALAQERQAPMQVSTQKTTQNSSPEASDTFASLVRSASQNPTAAQAHFQTFAGAPQDPIHDFTQITSQDSNDNTTGEFGTPTHLQESSQNHIGLQTPAHEYFRAPLQVSKQAVARAPAQDVTPVNDSVGASLRSLNLPFTQDPSALARQSRIQGSTRVFQAPVKVQTPVQTPLQSPQVHRTPGPVGVTQNLVPSQKKGIAEAFEIMPFLTFAEFIATGPQQSVGQSIGKPAEVKKPLNRQHTKKPTQKPTQKLNQYRVQKPIPNPTRGAAQKVTQQLSQKANKTAAAQPTQQSNKQPTPQLTLPDYYNNAPPHNRISCSAEPCGDAPPPGNQPNYLAPPLFCAPAEDPIILTDPVDPADPEVAKMVSDWWDKWIENSPYEAAPLSGVLEQEAGVQTVVPDLGLYFNENLSALAPTWDGF